MKKIICILICFFLFDGSVHAATLTVYCGATGDAGYVEATSVTWPPSSAGTISTDNMSIVKGAYSPYYVRTGLIRFNTSSLPDTATITSATLYIKNLDVLHADSRNINGEYYSFSTIGLETWTLDVGTTAFSRSMSGLTDNAFNAYTLGTLTSISKTGYTGFRIGVSGGVPSGDNSNTMYGYDGGSANKAYLTIEYSTGYAHEINGVANSPEVNGVANPTEVNGL